ncbi:hypothetical protein D3Z52_13480 [Clostridiaceae bacterium]|nr:hypothetical protein [Clostridiaceae bacterium]
MTLNRVLTAALAPIAPVEADTYEGRRAAYLTFGYHTIPADYADDEPGNEVALVHVHLFAPAGMDTQQKRRQIAAALRAAGMTAPRCVNASDKQGQHFVFECETAQGVGLWDG